MKKTLLTLILACGILLSQEIVVDTTSKMPKMEAISNFTRDNSKEIVTNEQTGFTRDNSKEIVTNEQTGLMFQDDKRAKSVQKSWSGAKAYCKNLIHGGYSDWRLPSISELESIADTTRYDPAIKEVFHNTTSSGYWSSSPNVPFPGCAWSVRFEDGFSDYYSKTYNRYVRCARAGQ